MESHLLQMRGLKQEASPCACQGDEVASFTDAWIETTWVWTSWRKTWSHLLQMRGLKQFGFIPD